MEINIAPTFHLKLDGKELRLVRKALRDLANQVPLNDVDVEMSSAAERLGLLIISQLKSHAVIQLKNLEGASAR